VCGVGGTVRRKTRAVRAGGLRIGGGAPVSVQGMTKTDTRDVAATTRAVAELAAARCQLARLAVPDAEAVAAFGRIRQGSPLPLCADIHFDHRLALAAIAAGADKLRINPGNIGSAARVREVAAAARERGIPIRVGVNAGSLPAEVRRRHGGPTAAALCEAALSEVAVLEAAGFGDIVISVKAHDVFVTLDAYRLLAAACDYPFHAGITEAGPGRSGLVRSAAGLALLLAEGLGDTLRVSLTAPAVEEVLAGRDILRSLGLVAGAVIVSCPTCGRCQVDLMRVAEAVAEHLADVERPIKVAVMGCPVNGPGEAKDADVGLAAGPGGAAIFRKGRVVRRVAPEEMVAALLAEIAVVLGAAPSCAGNGESQKE